MARSKFNVDKNKDRRTYNGEVFDSELEKKFYVEVVIPALENGTIIKCERQIKYILQPSFIKDGKKILPIEYKADFVLTYADNSVEIVDTKGYAEPLALMKRKMFWYKFPDINYVWKSYSKKDGGWTTYENIQKGRKMRKKEKLSQEKKETKE